MAGLLFVVFFGWDIYTSVYDCEHLTGAVPVGGCEAFLQLPVYLWSGFPILFSGVLLAVIGAGLILVGRFIISSEAGGEITRQWDRTDMLLRKADRR